MNDLFVPQVVTEANAIPPPAVTGRASQPQAAGQVSFKNVLRRHAHSNKKKSDSLSSEPEAETDPAQASQAAPSDGLLVGTSGEKKAQVDPLQADSQKDQAADPAPGAIPLQVEKSSPPADTQALVVVEIALGSAEGLNQAPVIRVEISDGESSVSAVNQSAKMVRVAAMPLAGEGEELETAAPAQIPTASIAEGSNGVAQEQSKLIPEETPAVVADVVVSTDQAVLTEVKGEMVDHAKSQTAQLSNQPAGLSKADSPVVKAVLTPPATQSSSSISPETNPVIETNSSQDVAGVTQEASSTSTDGSQELSASNHATTGSSSTGVTSSQNSTKLEQPLAGTKTATVAYQSQVALGSASQVEVAAKPITGSMGTESNLQDSPAFVEQPSVQAPVTKPRANVEGASSANPLGQATNSGPPGTLVETKTIEPARLAEAHRSEIIEQVAHGMEVLGKSAESSLKLQLYPESLGKIDLRLTSNSEGVRIVMNVDQSSTASLLEKHLPDLKEMLANSGVNLAGVSIGVGGEQGSSGTATRWSASAGQTWKPQNSSAAQNTAESADSNPKSRLFSSSAIDYRI